MPIKFRTRSKHFGAVLDTRIWRDPWGNGIVLEILRDGADAWRKFMADNGLNDSPLLKKYIQEQWAIRDRNQTGGRMKTKLTDRQMKDQAAAKALDRTDLDAENRAALAKLKPGLIEVGIVVVVELPSAHVRCTACGERFELPENGAPCPKCGDLAVIDDPENLAAPSGDEKADAARQQELKAALLENLRDSAGHVLLIDRSDEEGEAIPHGGEALGDGMALAILAGMREQERFRADFQEEAADVLPVGSAGPSADG